MTNAPKGGKINKSPEERERREEKEIKKYFKNLLTNVKKCDIIDKHF